MPLKPAFLKKKKKDLHPHQLSGKMKNLWEFVFPILLTAHMFAPRFPLQGLLQLSICLGVQVKLGKRETKTSQQMICFNAGPDSNPDLHPVCLKLIRVEAWIYCINIHADVYLLSSSGRLSWTDCASLALTLRCWHTDRWVAGCPLGLCKMASTRMDGLIFKVQLVISQPVVYLLSYLLA